MTFRTRSWDRVLVMGNKSSYYNSNISGGRCCGCFPRRNFTADTVLWANACAEGIPKKGFQNNGEPCVVRCEKTSLDFWDECVDSSRHQSGPSIMSSSVEHALMHTDESDRSSDDKRITIWLHTRSFYLFFSRNIHIIWSATVWWAIALAPWFSATIPMVWCERSAATEAVWRLGLTPLLSVCLCSSCLCRTYKFSAQSWGKFYRWRHRSIFGFLLRAVSQHNHTKTHHRDHMRHTITAVNHCSG